MTADELAGAYTLSLARGATLRDTPEGHVEVVNERGRSLLTVDADGPKVALTLLADRGATEPELRAAWSRGDERNALQLYVCLLELSAAGVLGHGVCDGGAPIITAEPACSQYRMRPASIDRAREYVLSRFACVRRDGGGLVLESPRSFASIRLRDPRAMLLLDALAVPRRVAELSPDALRLSSTAAVACLALLQTLSFAVALDDRGVTDEDADGHLAGWEFHDLLFHTRSRRGRHRNPYGATFPLRGRREPLPAVKGPGPGQGVPLFRPDLDAAPAGTATFASVLEGRRSIRHQAATPITQRQLGEFLYRVARIRNVIPQGAREPYDATDRVYPSGGAAYPLELYAVISRCDGLASGLYHYRALEHELVRLSGATADSERLLRSAAYATASGIPQVLIVLAARVQRVTWKYSSIAYAAILKDVGVLFQTMYLVATAMGLGACAVGGGNSDLFARASGLPYFEEPSVGEFILGSPRLPDAPA